MASYNRTRRISEEIKKIIGQMLINGIKDPRITSMVSVTDVEVTNDLRYAFVYVSLLGGNEEESLVGLKSSAGFIRREVGKKIKLRYIPEIMFKVDDSIERGMYMDNLIRKVNEENSSKVEENEDEADE
ncbi:30S ribosome-binding factor RbfA [Peptacetobacter hominis]|uniref:Ribosome-binding factor A n=1 Tax=Peptacetobacter hominis TaxID=2743610 RepID=A0A544QTX0_9FIRM|nr:30S ribosome-binding factor RbfA [Peptacetobacter hominis]TQQ84149.1 30S ribosome-binding factor RbfA [Peptacetobacter hominis]